MRRVDKQCIGLYATYPITTGPCQSYGWCLWMYLFAPYFSLLALYGMPLLLKLTLWRSTWLLSLWAYCIVVSYVSLHYFHSGAILFAYIFYVINFPWHWFCLNWHIDILNGLLACWALPIQLSKTLYLQTPFPGVCNRSIQNVFHIHFRLVGIFSSPLLLSRRYITSVFWTCGVCSWTTLIYHTLGRVQRG